MTGVVDVIVDRDDDLATAHAIHNLAARDPTVLAVSIAPDWRDSPAAIWAILRALGKRTEHLDAATLNWQDTQRWLTAHQITELVILRAQHLKERTIQELKWHLVTLAGIAVTLLYSGDRAIPSHATTTITDLLSRPRPAPSTSRLAKWPIVPRSHPLRLRSDCSQHLAPDPFRKVDQLLCGACRTLSRWLQDRRPVSTAQLATAISIVSHGVDPDHAYIRQSATKIALALARIQPPPPRPLTIQPAAISDQQLAAILAHTDPGTAGFLLAEQLTQLPASHIELIGPDQITAERILGSLAPERARPVLQALTAGGYNLTSPRERRTPPARPPLEHGAGSAFERNEFTTTLGWLLETRRNVAHGAEITPETRALLDELCSHDILEQTQGVYRASCIALYSCYQDPLPPLRATDIQAKRSADIT